MRSLLPSLLLAAPLMAEELTIERIFDDPSLSGPSLRQPRLAPDGSRVTFLRERDDDAYRLDLWEYRIADGRMGRLVDSTRLMPETVELSDEEKARRERQRISGLTGIVDYQWAPDAQRLLFPLGGDLYLFELAGDRARRLTETEAFETDPQVSPRGRYVAFVRDQDLHVLDIESGAETRLTHDGGGVIKNAMAEFVAQEEMGRDTGYQWAPDDRHIAFLRVDESSVPVTQRYEIYADGFKVIDQRYPHAGGDNVRLRLGVVAVPEGTVRWVDLGPEADIYLPRLQWLPDGRRLAFQVQSRDQQRLELRVVDLADASAAPTTVLVETATTWVNLHDDLHFLAGDEAFIWSSERSGFRHLYRVGLDGEIQARLTAGDWPVDALVGVDEDEGWVYFTASPETPLEQHLFRQRLDAREPGTGERLTRQPAMHEITMSRDASVYVDSWSTPDQPPRVALHRADGERLAWLVDNRLQGGHPYEPYLDNHARTRFGTLAAADGQSLHYRLTVPADFDPSRRYPVLVHVYGGPHAQMVTRSWSRRALFEQYLARRGVLVFALDNRGSARRGTRFENAIYQAMGKVEVADQMVGVAHLRSLDYVDPARIGVFGWSYGGYMTLHLLFQHPEAFAAGVAVAPVTDWSLYDTHYTERYLGQPGTAARAYAEGAVFPYAEGFDGALLVIHGMADDNVLFTHSTRLFEYLQQRGVLFDAVPYPGAKHGISGQAAQTHAYRTIARYLLRHLAP